MVKANFASQPALVALLRDVITHEVVIKVNEMAIESNNLLTLPVKLTELINYCFQFINFASQADRAPQQLAPITVAPFFTLPTMIHNRRQTTTPGTTCLTLSDKCVGSFTSHRIIEGL